MRYLIIFFIFIIPFTSYAARSLYISEDGLSLGVTCTSAGDNTNTDAIYLYDTTIITSPDTGQSPALSGCPTDIPLYGANSPKTNFPDAFDGTGYLDKALQLLIDPNPGSGEYYGNFYVKECDGTFMFLDTNECPSQGGGTLSSTTATTTEALLASMIFGQGILIAFGFMGFTGYIYNRISSKKKKLWQR